MLNYQRVLAEVGQFMNFHIFRTPVWIPLNWYPYQQSDRKICETRCVRNTGAQPRIFVQLIPHWDLLRSPKGQPRDENRRWLMYQGDTSQKHRTREKKVGDIRWISTILSQQRWSKEPKLCRFPWSLQGSRPSQHGVWRLSAAMPLSC